MDSIIKKLVGDLVKGAAQAEGFIRGSRMRVDLGGDLVGQKIAGLGGGLGGALGPLGAAAGAGLQDKDSGSAVGAGLGSLAGGVAGMPLGMLGGGLLGVPIGALVNLLRGEDVGEGALAGGAIGGGIGGLAGTPIGSMLGGHMGQNHFRDDGDKKSPRKEAALHEAFGAGATSAAARFGVKESNALMQLGAKMLPQVGNFLMKHPVGQQVTGTLASNAVNHMMQPRQPAGPVG